MFKMQVDLTRDKILKGLILFSIPIFISMLFQMLYNTVDTMVIGRTLGDAALAAIGSSASVFELLVGFAQGVGTGFCIVAARHYGSGDMDKLKKSVAGSVVIGIGLTIVLMLVAKVGLYPLLRVLETPENVIEEAYSYIGTVSMFVGVMFAYNLFSSLLRSIGNSFMPLVFLILSSLLNVVLDILFITRFNMGVRGAAVATVIAQGVSAALCLVYILLKAKELVPGRKHLKIDTELYLDLMGQGFSMGFMGAIVSSGSVILQRSINQFGYRVVAGHTTARKVFMFCMMPFMAVGMAISTFVSQNKGAGNDKRVVEGMRVGFKFSVIWAALVTLAMLVFGRWLCMFISGSVDPEVIDYATLYAQVSAPFFAVLGILLIIRNSLQGVGLKVVPLISSVIEFVGKILFSMVIIPYMGKMGIILCEPLIWCVMTAQLYYSYRKNILAPAMEAA